MQQQAMINNQNAKPRYHDSLFDDLDLFDAPQPEKKVRHSKKESIINLYTSGITDILEISQQVKTRPSYVAAVLQSEGLLKGYYDLYTTTANDQNIYSRFFRNVLSFKSPQAARESVERIDGLYRYFEKIGDRAGQHHAQVLALTGRNRARWSGKPEEARIFTEWLLNN